MPSVTGVVLEACPPEQAGTASAVFNTFRQVGGAVAIAVFGALIARAGPSWVGLHVSLGIAAALLLLTALRAFASGPGAKRRPDPFHPRRNICSNAPSAPTGSSPRACRLREPTTATAVRRRDGIYADTETQVRQATGAAPHPTVRSGGLRAAPRGRCCAGLGWPVSC